MTATSSRTWTRTFTSALLPDKPIVRVLDQTALPLNEVWLEARTQVDCHEYIKNLVVRGAPNIGLLGAFGMAMALQKNPSLKAARRAHELLVGARPTAVNLKVCCDAVLRVVEDLAVSSKGKKDAGLGARISERAWSTACSLYRNEERWSNDMAFTTSRILSRRHELGDVINVLTICNTGILVSPGYGTALGGAIRLHEMGYNVHVASLETRPLLQGARLTAWECSKMGIPCTQLVDGAAPSYIEDYKVSAAIVGADRIAANGDTANKIGTHNLAIVCKTYGIPLYVVAPQTTLDPNTKDGSSIEIEQRNGSELNTIGGTIISTGKAYNPAFDVTPHELISGWIIGREAVLHPDDLAGL